MSIRLSRPHRPWAWMLPCLFPMGVLGALVLISLSSLLGYVLVMVWGWVLFPYGAAYIRSQARTPGADNESPLSDGDTDYWRTSFYSH